MRTTEIGMAYNQLYYLQQTRSKIDNINEKIGSGQNINKPSDNPEAYSKLVELNSSISANNQYLTNINKANTWLSLTNNSLEAMYKTMECIKKISSDTNFIVDDPELALSQLKSYRQEMVDFSDYNSDKQSINISISEDTEINLSVPKDALNINTDILADIDSLISAITNENFNSIKGINTKLEIGYNQIESEIKDVSTKLTTLDSNKTIIEGINKIYRDTINKIQNVDYAELAVKLNLERVAYEATLKTISVIDEMMQEALDLI